MAAGPSEQELYKAAEKRTDDLIGFFVHAMVYVVVNAGIWLTDIVAGGGVEWAYWVTIPWGIGLTIHTLVLLFELKLFGADWRRRQIERYVERHRGSGSGAA